MAKGNPLSLLRSRGAWVPWTALLAAPWLVAFWQGALPGPLCGVGHLVLASGVATIVYRFDKRRAIAGGRRVMEANLLGLALGGGAAGAFWAMRSVRHKTQRRTFTILVPLFLAAHLVLLGWWAWCEYA
jgi:uncharacterized membrane protein YsdA (DUF1294 family)